MTDRQAGAGARSAAYAYDGRAPGWTGGAAAAGEWHPRLAALVGAGYLFLPQGYAGGGALFRGMGAGLCEALAADAFWHFPSDRPLARLERELDVIFCSEHAGDALSASRPWQGRDADAALLVFGSDGFQRRARQRAAAVLALADPGMVFRYPLLAEPLRWIDLDRILVGPQTDRLIRAAVAGEPSCGLPQGIRRDLRQRAGAGLFDRLEVVDTGDREGWAAAVENCLQRLQRAPARVIAMPDVPRAGGPAPSGERQAGY